ncbi:uncharacterized protein [Maniola hyperantus]|uniref:uncharacterized protein isoform X2 n=1 Tax=Aphantopus hyperantus TaxID=2795564 RepID=UPI00374A6682
MPSEFDEPTADSVARIENNSNVLGIMFFRQNLVEMCTAPENMAQTLSTNLPALSSTVQQAIGEIDVLDELVAYRVLTNKIEILVVVDQLFAACVVQKHRNKKHRVREQLSSH